MKNECGAPEKGAVGSGLSEGRTFAVERAVKQNHASLLSLGGVLVVK